jgi:23S rRNA pseudouridine2605 synthase
MPKPSAEFPSKADETYVPGSLVRLQRYLAMAGAGSRRHCEDFILMGRVTVDGKVVSELGTRVDPETQLVRLDGERIRVHRRTYYLLNKPIGYLCTNRDPDGRPRVVDLFPRDRERLFTVGRLDENSQGLLLVTNDGELANHLAHPRFRVRKVYLVQVAGVPTRETVEQLTQGAYFAEGKFKAAEARLVKVRKQSAILEIVLTEGQNREIRRLLAKLGHKVQSLQRVALGPLELGALDPGHFRPLDFQEVQALHAFVKSLGGRERGKSPGKRRAAASRGPRTADRKENRSPASRRNRPQRKR